MSNYVVKIALIASIILMGSNISEFLANFKTASEKIGELLSMAKANSATEAELRRSNIILSCILSVVYVALVYFSDIVIWIVALVVLKLLFTLLVDPFL